MINMQYATKMPTKYMHYLIFDVILSLYYFDLITYKAKKEDHR